VKVTEPEGTGLSNRLPRPATTECRHQRAGAGKPELPRPRSGPAKRGMGELVTAA